MKRYLLIVTVFVLAAAVVLSCKKESSSSSERPSTPGKITLVTNSGSNVVGPLERFTLKTDRINGAWYTWTIPAGFKVEGTLKSNNITLYAEKAVTVPAGSIKVIYKLGEFTSEPSVFERDLEVTAFRTKKYGSKIWMIDNCNETGTDGKLGRSIDEFGITTAQYAKINELKLHTGRYYTWYEMMTGISGCNKDDCAAYIASKGGIDDMGNSFTLDGGSGEYNVQLRGCCPKGWHIANCNDWWDLFSAIEVEYCDTRQAGCVRLGEEGFSFEFTGFPAYTTPIEPVKKEGFYSATQALMISNVGNLGAYLRGGKKEEGFWIYSSDAYGWPNDEWLHSVYYTPKRHSSVEFDWYPCSYVKHDGSFIATELGKQGIFWLGFTDGVKTDLGKAFRLKCDGHQFTQVVNGDAGFNAKSGRLNVRCVKNY